MSEYSLCIATFPHVMTYLSVPFPLEERFVWLYFAFEWYHPSWKFIVYASGKKCGADFAPASSQHKAVCGVMVASVLLPQSNAAGP